jgi:hypothetical protein
MTFEPSGNPYIITETIVVQKGKKTIIKPGCVFLFKPFSGLEVQGSMVVNGIQNEPVVFTSANDGKYNPKAAQIANPFDWNGINVGNNGQEVRFANFVLAYSIFGIKSQTEEIAIENGIFRQNGQFHFTINDGIKPVQEDIPFSFNADQKNRPKEIKKTPIRPLRIAAVLTGVSGVSCAIAAIPFFSAAAKANHEGNERLQQTEINEAWQREASALNGAGILSGAAALLIPATVVLLVLDERQKPPTISLLPVFDCNRAGFCLNFRF